jgi:hypothetical protein
MLFEKALKKDSTLTLPTDLGALPTVSEFSIEWNKRQRWERLRLTKLLA